MLQQKLASKVFSGVIPCINAPQNSRVAPIQPAVGVAQRNAAFKSSVPLRPSPLSQVVTGTTPQSTPSSSTSKKAAYIEDAEMGNAATLNEVKPPVLSAPPPPLLPAFTFTPRPIVQDIGDNMDTRPDFVERPTRSIVPSDVPAPGPLPKVVPATVTVMEDIRPSPGVSSRSTSNPIQIPTLASQNHCLGGQLAIQPAASTQAPTLLSRMQPATATATTMPSMVKQVTSLEEKPAQTSSYPPQLVPVSTLFPQFPSLLDRVAPFPPENELSIAGSDISGTQQQEALLASDVRLPSMSCSNLSALGCQSRPPAPATSPKTMKKEADISQSINSIKSTPLSVGKSEVVTWVAKPPSIPLHDDFYTELLELPIYKSRCYNPVEMSSALSPTGLWRLDEKFRAIAGVQVDLHQQVVRQVALLKGKNSATLVSVR
jgi:hypothetical protein